MYDVHTTQPSPEELDDILRRALKSAVQASRFSVEQIADQLGVNKSLVYAWIAPSGHSWHLPAYVVPRLCEILGDDSIQRLLLSEKLRQSLELGESTPRIVSLLRSALSGATERKNDKGQKQPKRPKQ